MESHQENPKKRDREEEEDSNGFPRKRDFPPPPAADVKVNVKLKLRIGKSLAGEKDDESPEKKDHVCAECNKRFSSGKALGGHMSSAHVQANRDYSYKKKQQVRKCSDEEEEEDEEEEGRREYYRGKDGEITCPHCDKKFPSRKSLFGHMRCHPDRYWRGMEPPPSVFHNNNKVAEEEDDKEKDKDEEISNERVDLQRYLSSWASRAKRGRFPINQRSPSSSDDEELQEAVQHLVCLGNSHQNPNLLEIHRNGEEKERFRSEERSNSGDEDESEDVNRGMFLCANPNNIDCPNGSVTAANSNNNRKKRRIVEKTMRPLLEFEAESAKDDSEKFKCSTCNKCFSTHQALGGHRSSHNKFKISVQNAIDECIAASSGGAENNQSSPPQTAVAEANTDENNNNSNKNDANTNNNNGATSSPSSKYHQCNVCNKIFATGKALGGHKKCHSTPPQSTILHQPAAPAPNSPERSSTHTDNDQPKLLDFDLNEIPDDG